MSDGSCYYFGYASNLLRDNMKRSLPDPHRVNTGRLENYKLIFETYNVKWHGHFAHAASCPGAHIWGVIYRISQKDKEDIYRQESVDIGVYVARDAEVTTPEGNKLSVFFITKRDSHVTLETPPTSDDCKPSPQYKSVILEGAIENSLPEEYVSMIRAVPDNGYQGDFDFREIKSNFD